MSMVPNQRLSNSALGLPVSLILDYLDDTFIGLVTGGLRGEMGWAAWGADTINGLVTHF